MLLLLMRDLANAINLSFGDGFVTPYCWVYHMIFNWKKLLIYSMF